MLEAAKNPKTVERPAPKEAEIPPSSFAKRIHVARSERFFLLALRLSSERSADIILSFLLLAVRKSLHLPAKSLFFLYRKKPDIIINYKARKDLIQDKKNTICILFFFLLQSNIYNL